MNLDPMCAEDAPAARRPNIFDRRRLRTIAETRLEGSTAVHVSMGKAPK
jgi:hypothetical protein